MSFDRRDFLKFLGVASATYLTPSSVFNSQRSLKLEPLDDSPQGELRLAKGFQASLIAARGDPLFKGGDKFGSSSDFISVMQGVSPNEIFLWINHESPEPLFLHGEKNLDKKTKSHFDLERASVGGSFIVVKRSKGSNWRVAVADPRNFRLTGSTSIPFSKGTKILNSRIAAGTLANCSGGQTPWGTFLSGEEDYEDFYPETPSYEGAYGWTRFSKNPSEHYGWVVEIDPQKKKAKKLVSLGRFAHEGALVIGGKTTKAVVYMGDDSEDQCLYKFIASRPGSLDDGVLYVANFERGQWLPVNPEKKLKNLIHTRDAAKKVGGSSLDRPEGVAIDPLSGDVFVALTGDQKKGNPYGSILKISEKAKNYESLIFQSDTFLAGGPKSGIAMPDNLVFDSSGNLWICMDIGAKKLAKAPYESFQRNSLFVIPRSGELAGLPVRIASAPRGAEFTGPALSPDEKTLFISV